MDWKQTRAIVTPTFSSKKLKDMAPLVERICDSLNERMEEISKGNESAEVWRLFGQFTMETILATAFGRQVNVLKGEANELTKAAAGFFSTASMSLFIWNITIDSQLQLLKSFKMFFTPQNSKSKNHLEYILKISLELIKERRQLPDSNKYMDFLQLLMEASVNDNDELSSSTKNTLTDEEIVGLCVDFLLAGYETTSNCLAFTAYLLALNTDIQDKLCQIIEDYYQENEDATLYDASHDIQYLDWVISESLRMYPPAARTARYCSETCNINGVIIPEDMIVIVPIKSLHYSSEYWDEPDVFRPERFSPEEKEKRHPLCYMPFGWGPRNCIGMRFALMEAKMALVSMLRKYKFQVAPDTEIPLQTVLGVTYSPANGIYLNVITVH
jgi:cytochrome P450